MPKLSGRAALVVGAASGIGRAVSEAFAAAGARVAIADHGREAERRELAAKLRAGGVDAFDVECDVTQESQVAGAIAETLARFGKLEILVNNAGIGGCGYSIVEQDWADWERVFAVNLMGVAYGMKHGLKPMLTRGYGRIINTASQLAHKATPHYAAYCASKAAVVGLTRSVALEVAAKGVAVNCVSPGPTDTPMWRAADPEWNRRKLEELPIKRVGRPEEIAAAYVFLASEEAGFMIGQSVSPNGGDVMW